MVRNLATAVFGWEQNEVCLSTRAWTLVCEGSLFSMPRRFIQDLTDGEAIDDVYYAAEKQLRTNRSGGRYLLVRLMDRTGQLVAMLWNANDKMVEMFEAGNYVRVQGTTQIYNGTLQVIATRIERVPSREVEESDFFPLSEVELDRLAQRLERHLRGIQDNLLRCLAECFLMDEHFMRRLQQVPAAIKHHHAFRGGLLQHVVTMLDVAEAISPLYPQLNRDLLKMGIFLHDLGKVEELAFERELGYTDAGQLVGHVVQGVQILDRYIAQAERLLDEPFPEPLALQLKHMILSHHGSYEFGSPKLPMTLEALALHYIDSLDAQLYSFARILQEGAQPNGWTAYQPHLSRKLFRTYDPPIPNNGG